MNDGIAVFPSTRSYVPRSAVVTERLQAIAEHDFHVLTSVTRRYLTTVLNDRHGDDDHHGEPSTTNPTLLKDFSRYGGSHGRTGLPAPLPDDIPCNDSSPHPSG